MGWGGPGAGGVAARWWGYVDRRYQKDEMARIEAEEAAARRRIAERRRRAARAKEERDEALASGRMVEFPPRR